MRQLLLILPMLMIACSGDPIPGSNQPPVSQPEHLYRYLALGDSYTIGESVCADCRFPAQLEQRLEEYFGPGADITTDIIAQTGWTTTNLKGAINSANLTPGYDLVTLLIGVNNQYQNRPFSVYMMEFPQLVSTAIALAGGDSTKVIVVSIPDYAYTPFGQGSGNAQFISTEIDQYNAFAESYCAQNGIAFVDITGITRMGLQNPQLVASDGLHPSEQAYTLFVNEILPVALQAIN